MELKLKPLSPKLGTEIPFPAYATSGSAGMDLRACIDGPMTIRPRERVKVPAGFAISLPDPGYAAFIFARSGLGIKSGITLPNCVGVIDSDYRGEVIVGLSNHSGEDYVIEPGERIAQLVITPVAQPHITVAEDLDDTGRGAGGFGSTGRN